MNQSQVKDCWHIVSLTNNLKEFCNNGFRIVLKPTTTINRCNVKKQFGIEAYALQEQLVKNAKIIMHNFITFAFV